MTVLHLRDRPVLTQVVFSLSSKMQHANTAVNVRALAKLIDFCGGQLKDPESGDKTDCSYILVGDRTGRKDRKSSRDSVAETDIASNFLSLEGFIAVASGDSDGNSFSGSASKRHCVGYAGQEQIANGR